MELRFSEIPPHDPTDRLFELVGDLVDAGLGARLVLLAARRTGDADRNDDVVAGLDRQCALGRDDACKLNGPGCRIVLYVLDDCIAWDAAPDRSLPQSDRYQCGGVDRCF
jgi:hypothetical protein